jgi:hypothetical protein
MNCSRSGLIIRSRVDTRYHDCNVTHAGGPAGSVRTPTRSAFAPRPSPLPLAAAAVAGLAAVLADLTLLAILGDQALATPGSLVWAPVIVAVGASLSRITLAGRAARRCLATRATLT